MKTSVQTWVFRISVVISILELVLFALWITSTLPKFGERTANTLMNIGAGLAVIGGIASLGSTFTRKVSQFLISVGTLLVSVFVFGWLWLVSWIGSM